MAQEKDDCAMTLKERWSDDRFQDMSAIWKLTEDDQAKMRDLQQRVADVDHWKNDPYEIIRYFCEFKGQLPKVEKTFRHMIQWRIDKDIDTFLERYGEPDPRFHFYPIGVLEGTDKQGGPVYLDRMGETDSYGYLKEFGIDAMIDYQIFVSEYENTRSFWSLYETKVGHRVANMTVLIDLHGLSAGHLRPGLLPMLQRISRILQDCYAGQAKRIFLLRAPKVFYYIWSIAKHFFDPHIRDMITVTNHDNYLEILEKEMDVSILPACMVPDKQGPDRNMPGYFENIGWEGGPIPSLEEAERAWKERQELLLKQPKHRDRLDTGETSLASSESSSSSSINSTMSATTMSVSVRSMVRGHWNEADDIIASFPCI